MSAGLRERLRTCLAYKILCVLKWATVSFLVAGYCKLLLIIKAHYLDKQLGIETSDFVSFRNIRDSFRDGRYKDGEIYEAISYEKLGRVLAYLQMTPKDVFVDLGCGKGRAVLMAARQPLRKAVGVELRADLYFRARANLDRLNLVTEVVLLNADAATVDMQEGTVFFMFNPFGYRTIIDVLARIRDSLAARPRDIRIVYINSVYADLLDSQPWLRREQSLGDPKDVIWTSKL
ncbi:MAG: hypothetical protein HGA80_01175 [Candidatus Omnitrophica bacterium]|nr:hypothetical protein [Candidatus Omnitrophota bacterium]